MFRRQFAPFESTQNFYPFRLGLPKNATHCDELNSEPIEYLLIHLDPGQYSSWIYNRSMDTHSTLFAE